MNLTRSRRRAFPKAVQPPFRQEVTHMTQQTTLPRSLAASRAGIALLLTTLTLAGCAQPFGAGPGTQPQIQPPVQSAVPNRARDRLTARDIEPAPEVGSPVASAVPARSGPTGPIDGRTGLHQAALVSISGSADSQYTVLFRPSATDQTHIENAPARLCDEAGRALASSRTNSPGSSSAMPGVQIMIVTCGAA
ncbi:hypothetical protein FNJ84_06150 [Paracoccus sp. M683]|uniref:hypothetical protein n=1 Tax=Paracoccus sp. M683 TaxID=2594268 RepID=UPI0011809558|nr:hypothetical protein [Paracoccus sp. M683]TRW98357.1 hypothetical protein FNJ84_06150 [Paracoccus sp. M683]